MFQRRKRSAAALSKESPLHAVTTQDPLIIERLPARILLSADLPGLDLVVLDKTLSSESALEERSRASLLERSINSEIPDNIVFDDSTIGSRVLVVVDSKIVNFEQIISDISKNTAPNTQLTILVIETGEDGLSKISNQLSSLSEINEIHLFSHGINSGIEIGNDQLTLLNLADNASQLELWKSSLADGADISLYGCDLAESRDGQVLIDEISRLTGADVAASTDTTGTASAGGDWDLEYRTGEINSLAPISLELQDDYASVLGTFTVTNINDSGAGSFRQAILDANAAVGSDTIDFNIVGSGPHIIDLGTALPSINDEVFIDGTTEPDFVGNGSHPVVIIDGSGLNDDGINFTANSDNSEIRGLVIRDFDGSAISIDAGADNIVVAGNFLGSLDTDGLEVVGEEMGSAIIYVEGGSAVIGGNTTADRNVIAGGEDGVLVSGVQASGTQISGNYIGLDETGNSIVMINTDGVYVETGAANVTIGGATAAHGNLIAGMNFDAIHIESGNADLAVVQNNVIGVSASGDIKFGVGNVGVLLENGPGDITIKDNLIAGASITGIEIDGSSDGTVIQGNVIGTDASLTYNWGSGGNGILLENGAINTVIGGTAVGEGNVVAYSGASLSVNQAGVAIEDASTGNTIVGNSIFGSRGTGIDLSVAFDDGADPNDSGDGDTGGNDKLNWAVLSATSITGAGDFGYNLDTTTLNSGTYTVDFYASDDLDGGEVEGKRYLSSTTISGAGGGSGSLSGVVLNPGEYVTVTVTDAVGNTSEFSNYSVATSGDVGGAPPDNLLVTTTVAGGLSINQDGGDDVYLKAEDGGALLGGLTNFTIETQLTLDSSPGFPHIIEYAVPGEDRELALLLSSDTVRFSLGGTSVGFAGTYSQLRDGDSHALSVSWDGTSGDLKLYIDGTYQETIAGFRTGYTVAGGGALIVGNDQKASGGGFQTNQSVHGTLFDIRVFDYVRSATEILANHNTMLPYDEFGMLANWRFDALSTGDVVTDSVSSNNFTLLHIAEPGFTASSAALVLTVDENALTGTVVGSVVGNDPEREALISSLLADNIELYYSAETGKFYQYVDTGMTWTLARDNALTTTLNGVAGQLVTIDSAEENKQIVDILNTNGATQAYFQASDAASEGEWRQGDQASDLLFWQGDGSGFSVNGIYSNWDASNPNNFSGDQHYAKIFAATGAWDDVDGGGTQKSVIEFNGDAVLDNAGPVDQQPLLYSIIGQSLGGAFAIDPDSGAISVSDGTGLDFESLPVHVVTIRVTDFDGNTYDKAVSIDLTDQLESDSAPTDLSSGIEINSNGDGNDAYLVTANPTSVFDTVSTELTIETVFSLKSSSSDINQLFSYADADGFNQLGLVIRPTGVIALQVDGVASNSAAYTELLDGDKHHVAASWSSQTGDVAFYVDGRLVETTSGHQVGSSLGTNGVIVLAQDQDSVGGGFNSTQNFAGTYYDVRLWNDVRTAEEIALNSQHKFASASLPSGLVANWQMNSFNGSNEVVDIVAGNNLSIGHAVGVGFSDGTAVEDLTVYENSVDGTSVGYLVPTDPDLRNDLVSDGLFLQSNSGGWQTFTEGQTFGDWTVVSGSVDHSGAYPSVLGGVGVDLERGVGDPPGVIGQTLATEIGREYQIVLSATGNFSGGDPVKHFRVSAAGYAEDFAVLDTGVYEPFTMRFTATSTSTELLIQAMRDTGFGAVVSDISVIEIPEVVSNLLNNDTTLQYDAATGKFYRIVPTSVTWATAQAAAAGAQLNGVAGQLLTIHSAHENNIAQQMVINESAIVWMGASDQLSEGDWRWYEDEVARESFWSGASGGFSVNGLYSNWGSSEPNDAGGVEDYSYMTLDGSWNDHSAVGTLSYIIEWDASEVVSHYEFNLLDDAGGRFAIDSSTGEITVADGTLLDYETDTSHDVNVEVTDATGYSYDEVMNVKVSNRGGEPTHTLPGAQLIPDTNETLTFSTANGNSVSVSDTDPANDIRLQVFISVNDGVLTLSQTTGLSILGGSNGGTFMTLQGSEVDINAALEGMIFTPDPDYSGAVTLEMTTSLEADLVGRYTFDGGNAVDQSVGLSQNGTLMGDATTVVDGQRGEVLSLDGSGDYVEISGLFGEPANVTLAAWINSASVDVSGAVVISMGQSPALYLEPNGTLTGFYESGGVNYVVTSSESLLGTGWRHVAVTIDTVTQELVIFIDGSTIDTIAAPAAIEYDNSPDTYIGRDGTGGSDFDFNGLIDDARIYSRALSTDEVLALSQDTTSVSGTVPITINNVNDVPELLRVDEIDFSSYAIGDLDTQNGWVSEKFSTTDDIQITAGAGFDGSAALIFNTTGSGVGVSASLVGGSALPDLNDADSFTTEWSMKNSNLGGQFAFGYDANDDGQILQSSGEQALSVELIDSADLIRVTLADGSTLDVNPGISSANWVDFRWEIDLNANAGQGSGTLYYRDATAGQTAWQTDATLTGINLTLNPVAADKTNAANWDAIYLHMEDADNGFDNYRIEVEANSGHVTYEEGGTATILDSNMQVFDEELSFVGDFNGSTLTLVRDGGANSEDQYSAKGTLATLNQGANNLVVGATTIGSVTQNSAGALVLTFNANATNELVNEAMQQIAYSNSSDSPLTEVQIGWLFDDGNTGVQGTGGALQATGSTSVNITAVNDDPVVTFGGGNVTYVENSSPIFIDASVTVNDVDLTDFSSGVLSVSVTANGSGDDRIRINNEGMAAGQVGMTTGPNEVYFGGVLIGTWTGSGAPLAIAFNTSANATAVEAVAQNIVFENLSDNPSTLTRTVEFTLTDGDGGTSTAIAKDITVTAVNDEPVITSDGGVATAAINAAENQTAVTTVVATDADAGDVPTFAVSGGADAGLFSIDPNTGALTFNTAPNFESFADANTDGVYEVEITADDGNTGTDVQLISVTVTDVNETPSLVAISNSAVAENTDTSSGFSVGTLTSTDVDAGETYTYSIVGGADSGVFTVGGGSADELVLTDGVLDFESQSSYAVTVRTTDSGGLTHDQALTISVSDQNETPSFTSTAIITGTEDVAYNYNITTTDPDTGDSLTITDLTLPAWLTLTDNNDGTATLVGTPTNGDLGPHSVSLQVSDGSLQATQDFSITVSNVNDAPVITSNGGAATAAISAAENQTAVTTVVATDADIGDVPTFAVSGGADAGLFSIDPNTGALTFNTAPSFESFTDANTDGVYEVEITAEDGNTGTDIQLISVTVTDVNEPPTLVAISSSAVAENTDTSSGFSVGTLTSTDVDAGETYTYSIVGGADSGVFTVGGGSADELVLTDGVLDFESQSSYAVTVRTTDSGGLTHDQALTISVSDQNETPSFTSTAIITGTEDVAYNYNITTSDPDTGDSLTITDLTLPAWLTLTDNNDGTATLTGTPTNASVGPHSVSLQVSDGSLQSTQDFTITVSNVNDAPVITSNGGAATAAISAAENQTAVTTVVATDADVGDVPTFAVSGGADAGLFSIDPSTGVLTFDSAPNFESFTDANTDGVYEVEITADDGNTGTDVQLISVTVTDVNEPPTLVAISNSAVAENTDTSSGFSVGTLTSTDVDAGETYTYSIVGGADSAVFTVGGGSLDELVLTDGVLDFESQSSYAVTVRTTDSGGLIRDQALVITVTDQNESPSFTSTAIITGTEDVAYNYNITTSDPDTGDSLAITDLTLPAWLTLTDNNDGTASLVGTPTNGDLGPHSVSLHVSDGSLQSTQDFTITVSNLNDAPVITSNGGAATAAISAAENQTAVTTVVATDADVGDIPTFAVSGGADAGLFTIDPSTGVLTFDTAPNFESFADANTDGVYEVEITADDGNTGTDVQLISVTVTDVNETPTLVAISSSAVAENTDTSSGFSVGTLTSTDVDAGETYTYSIVGGADSAVFTVGGGSADELLLTDGVLDFENQSSYAVTVRTTDSGGLTHDQALTISVTDQNEAPSFTSTAIIISTQDVAYSYSITTTDPDTGDSLTITDLTLPAWLTLTDNTDGTATLTGTPTNASVGPHSVSLQVSDGSLQATQDFTITVTNVNDAPVITSNGGAATAAISAAENQTAVTTVVATDADAGDVPTFAVSGGADAGLFSIDPNTGVLTFDSAPNFESFTEANTDGVYEVEVTADDGNTGTDVQLISVTVTNVNEAPTLVAISNSAVAENTDTSSGFSVGTLTSTDVDAGETYTYSIVGGADSAVFTVGGGSLDELILTDGVLDFESQSSYAVTVRTTDSGGLTHDQALVITVTDQNESPSFTSTAIITGTEDVAYNYNITTTDPDTGGSLTITDLTLPAWLTLTDNNDGTATLVGTPTNGDLGPHSVSLQVSDGSLQATQDFSITVSNVNDAPVITSNGGTATAAINAAENQLSVTTVVATDADIGDVPTFAVSGGADAGLFSIDPNTGALTFNTAPSFESFTDANTDGVYEVEITAEDGNTGTDIQLISVTVTDVNEPPTLVAISNSAVAENTDTSSGFSVGTLTSTDVDAGETYTYSIVGGADSAVFTVGGGSADELVLTDGVLDFESQSSYAVTVRVTDTNGLTHDQALVISVTDQNETPTFTSTAIIDSTANVAYSYNITATDPDSDNSLTFTGLTQPAWLTLVDHGNGTATLAGTPSNAEAGPHEVRIQVSDGSSQEIQIFTVSVTSANDPPIITSDGGGATAVLSVVENQTAVTIVTSSNADLNDFIEYSITGGDDAQLFQINAATGSLSFTTSQDFERPLDSDGNGIYEVEVSVSDDGGLFDTQLISIVVTFAPDLGNALSTVSTVPQPFVAQSVSPTLSGIDTVEPMGTEQGEVEAEPDTLVQLTIEPESIASSFPVDSLPLEFPVEAITALEATVDPAPSSSESVNDTENLLSRLLRKWISAVSEIDTALQDELDRQRFLSELSDQIDGFDEQGESEARKKKLVAQVATGLSLTLTAGFVSWILRAGSMVASLLTSMPAWRQLDLLPILSAQHDKDDLAETSEPDDKASDAISDEKVDALLRKSG